MKITGPNLGYDGVPRINEKRDKELKKAELLPEGRTKPKDSLEISKDAQVLRSNDVQPKDLTAVRDRINSGYYNRDEVTQKVVDLLLQDLKK